MNNHAFYFSAGWVQIIGVLTFEKQSYLVCGVKS